MKKIMTSMICALLAAMLFAAFIFIMDRGIERSEKAECLKWEQQSKEIENWYSVEWQREQCVKYDVYFYE